jgi:pheromone shutdown protein TraB
MIVVVDKDIILVGTAHISAKSVAEVRNAIKKYRPDIVAVELDNSRYKVLTKKRKWEESSILDVLKQGKGFLMLVQIFLAMFQRRLGKEFGVEPGSEMVAAIKEAKKLGVEVALVDRDITVTFKRAWRTMTFREKLRLFWYSIKALIGYDRIMEEEELELETEGKEGKVKIKEKGEKLDLDKLMDEDVISIMMEELKTFVPNASNALIDERNHYIARRIVEEVEKPPRLRKLRVLKKSKPDTKCKPKAKRTRSRVLAVVGAGHVKGIKEDLRYVNKLPSLESLDELPKKGVSKLKLIGLLIPLIFVAVLIWILYTGEYQKFIDIMLWWILINGIFSAVGAALARGHPVTVATAFAAAPFTSLNPAIGAGWVAGYVQAVISTPTVKDLQKLSEIETMKEFFVNPAIRVLMVAAFANLGSSIGTFVALPIIVNIGLA